MEQNYLKELEPFIKIARKCYAGEEFIRKARKIQVKSFVSSWFFEYYEGQKKDMRKVADMFVEDVKKGVYE